jgi:hypothetical protein
MMIEERIKELFSHFGTPSRLVTLYTGRDGMEMFQKAMKEQAEQNTFDNLKINLESQNF